VQFAVLLPGGWVDDLINLSYLVASVMFIFGLKGLTHPRTAVRGNLLGALGMLLGIVVTLFDRQILDFRWIVIGLAAGSILGAVMAVRVQMTAMPQMVALLNGFGGGASALVAGAYLIAPLGKIPTTLLSKDVLAATALSGFIGAVTLSGSLVAYAKLEELKFVKDVRFPAQQLINGLLAAGCIALGVLLVLRPEFAWVYWIIVLLALALGVLLVVSIGGADMPVVIALLNSYSGLAAAATGFVLQDNGLILIIAGSLVGASGIILTRIMCVAMNRSLTNVLFGTLQPAAGKGPAAEEVYATVKSTTADEVAMLLDAARRVVIVPGYGMAVAQAQHAVSDLTKVLRERGVQVEFGIHPVAGRMPGHMNVLLAEADIPYDLLKEMDEINSEMGQVDVAIVLGANDVVNPVARTDPNSPIAGMPIIEVEKARTVVVVKRSLSPGFAGIPNPLFAADNSLMLFEDGRKAIVEILKAVQGS
jgi:NAD(P) transhydrogenase subunit beta